MNGILLSKIDEYRELLNEKDRLKAETAENNKAVEACRDALAQMMVDEETPKISRSGYSYSLQSKTRFSKKGGMDDELFKLLRDHGLGDLIKETVNAQTLQGAMSSLAEENEDELPDDFSEVINRYDYLDVSKIRDSKSII